MEKEFNPQINENLKNSDKPPVNALKDRKNVLTTKRLETVVAILLGITTLLSAWATWIGSLHHGIQSINFTKSDHMASKGSAEYNLDLQIYISDYMSWNTLKDYNYELETAKIENNKKKAAIIKEKIKKYKKQNISDILSSGIKWMEKNKEDNPFKMPGMAEKYFKTAQEKIDKSQKILKEGMRDNKRGDAYNLVTVIFSLTLFLLGIVGTFKNMPNRITVLSIALAFLVVGFIYMCTIPLPTGFEQMDFLNFAK